MEQQALKKETKEELEHRLRFGGWFDSKTGETCLLHGIRKCSKCESKVQKHLSDFVGEVDPREHLAALEAQVAEIRNKLGLPPLVPKE